MWAANHVGFAFQVMHIESIRYKVNRDLTNGLNAA